MAENNTYNSFLGSGWSYPPAFSKATKSVEMTSGVEDIEKSLQILLSTRPGERVMQPSYGCNLDRLLFEPLDTSLKTFMQDLVKTALLYHEPRILPEKVSLEEGEPGQGIIYITIEYTVRTTNSRYNYVYPFYKEEGDKSIK